MVSTDPRPEAVDSVPDTDLGAAPAPRRSRAVSMTRKIGVLVVGLPILALGIVFIPLPGPGTLLIVAGLAVLSLEFAWADRLSRQIRDGFRKAWDKVTGRS